MDDQKIKPNEHNGKVGHVNDNIDHKCGQVYDNTSNEDVVLYLDCYHVHLENHFEDETEKPS